MNEAMKKLRVTKKPTNDDMVELSFLLKDKSDATADGFSVEVDKWIKSKGAVNIKDTKVNEPSDYSGMSFDDTKDKTSSLVTAELKTKLVNDFEKWLKSGNSKYLKESMDKIIIEKDILFEADGLDDGIIVSKGYSIKQVDEATNETYKVSKTFSTIVEGNRVFIAKDTILSISEEVELVEGTLDEGLITKSIDGNSGVEVTKTDNGVEFKIDGKVAELDKKGAKSLAQNINRIVK